MSQRPTAVLDRFPLHLAATDPGKRFGAVVTGLVADLDVLTQQIQTVRASRRISEAPTVRDLLALASLHRLGDTALVPLDNRALVLRDAAATTPLDVEALAGLLGVPAAVLGELAEADLAAALAVASQYGVRVRLRRGTVLGAIGAHRTGNTTPTALLLATAAYLGLKVTAVQHVPSGYWHLARALEQLRLIPPLVEGAPPSPDLTPLPDVLALEENPVRRADIEPTPKSHGQRTRILRGGLEDVDVTIRVLGLGNRTVRPMVVHLGTGRGLVYEGDVPDGAELAFTASGQVTLDGSDVTGSSWTFTGGVFADKDNALPGEDFVFTAEDGTVPTETASAGPPGQASLFAVAAPVAGAFDESPPLPHGAASVGPLQLPRGESRWTALIRVARSGGAAGEPSVPRTVAGRFDASVFAAATASEVQPAMLLGFAWEEREPFAVRVLLPQRFSAADDDNGTLLRQPLTRLLDRHRASGVDVRVEYADPRWALGEGVVRTGADDPLGVVLAGTQLWPDGTPQPEP
ncbi:hypothetical protein [Streptomyces sp. SID13031]|uniref:hypothetical protein n=1 Tax=Streptomyces sp. SID13031 TaxID=2706046 RepID=UPI0013CADD77|nr:hypothetical protein [Streptomyces sp. SID13031]NEA30686.1 hypothetical protein [Streptomyces sp. SID13031]